MIDAFTVGVQTLVMIVLAKTFVRTPLTLYGVLGSLLKVFFSFAPVLITVSWVTRGAQSLMTLLTLAFELSATAVLIVSAVKAILLHFHTEEEEVN
ncbi:MAG: hypothetical protein ACK4R8_10765 [Thiobacillus sp.]